MGKADRFKKQASKQETQMLNKINDIKTINIDEIQENSNQPRTLFYEETIKELSESIKEEGLLTPILITKDNLIISGGRRYKACKKLGHTTIRAIIVANVDIDRLLVLSILDNLHRENLGMYDEVMSIFALSKQGKAPFIAKKINKSLTWVKNRLSAYKIIQDKKITAKDILDKNLTLKNILDMSDNRNKIKKTLSNVSLNKTEDNGSKNISMEEMEKQATKDEKKYLKKISKENKNNDLIEQKINKNDIVNEEKLINEEKELVNFFSNYKGDDNMTVTVMTNGELAIRGSRLIFNEIMAILSKNKK